MAARRGFGTIRRLPSKRYQASYIGPDQTRHPALVTFTAREDAEGWLRDERKLIESGAWTSPQARRDAEAAEAAEAERGALTLSDFVRRLWLPELELRTATRRDYDALLRNHIEPTLGRVPVRDLDRARVRAWWASLDPGTPRARSKAFQLLHNIMAGAVELELVDANPVVLPRRTKIRTKRAKRVEPLTLPQLATLADAMPERLRMAVLLGCWCALRYGELAELRRSDIDLDAGTLTVSRGVVKVTGGYVVGPPKTSAGERVVHIPAALLPELRAHMAKHAAWGRDGLLFPAPNGGHMHSSSFARLFAKAAEAAGRPDATPHLLRHTGASLATVAGATIPDVMQRLGHTTPAAALVYQHALDGSDKRVAGNLSKMAEGAK